MPCCAIFSFPPILSPCFAFSPLFTVLVQSLGLSLSGLLAFLTIRQQRGCASHEPVQEWAFDLESCDETFWKFPKKAQCVFHFQHLSTVLIKSKYCPMLPMQKDVVSRPSTWTSSHHLAGADLANETCGILCVSNRELLSCPNGRFCEKVQNSSLTDRQHVITWSLPGHYLVITWSFSENCQGRPGRPVLQDRGPWQSGRFFHGKTIFQSVKRFVPVSFLPGMAQLLERRLGDEFSTLSFFLKTSTVN